MEWISVKEKPTCAKDRQILIASKDSTFGYRYFVIFKNEWDDIEFEYWKYIDLPKED